MYNIYLIKYSNTKTKFMRIAMIGQKGIPAIYGGIETHVEELSAQLAKNGHEVLVYARSWYTPKKIKTYKGVRIIHTPTIRTKNLDAIVHTFISTIHALFQKPDVIHYHGVGPALLSFIPRIFAPRVKVVATFHCVDRYHQKWGFIAKTMLALGEMAACAFPHETITVSKSLRDYCLNEHICNTTYIPNGVNLPKMKKGSDFGKLNIKAGKYVLMVSRLVRHKGAHYLIATWKKLQKKYPEILRDYKLVIAGDSVFTDDYIDELHYLANGDKSIIFAGWVRGEKLAQLYRNCALLVHPSENEGLPIIVLEAMSYGKATLLSDIAEHKELVTDRKFLFTNADVDSLSQKLIALLKNPEICKEIGAKNRQMVARYYNWDDIVEYTENIYLRPAIVKQTEMKLKMAKV